jgi:hypothetical protein
MTQPRFRDGYYVVEIRIDGELARLGVDAPDGLKQFLKDEAAPFVEALAQMAVEDHKNGLGAWEKLT